MPQQHPDYKIDVEVGKELAKEKAESIKAAKNVIPYGLQVPTAGQFQRDFETRGEEWRKRQLNQLGADKVLELLGWKPPRGKR